MNDVRFKKYLILFIFLGIEVFIFLRVRIVKFLNFKIKFFCGILRWGY